MTTVTPPVNRKIVVQGENTEKREFSLEWIVNCGRIEMALAVQELGAMFLEHHTADEEAVKAWPKAKADKWQRISPLLPLFTDLYVQSREHEKFVKLTPRDRAGDQRPKRWTIVPDTSGNGNFVLIFAVNCELLVHPHGVDVHARFQKERHVRCETVGRL